MSTWWPDCGAAPEACCCGEMAIIDRPCVKPSGTNVAEEQGAPQKAPPTAEST